MFKILKDKENFKIFLEKVAEYEVLMTLNEKELKPYFLFHLKDNSFLNGIKKCKYIMLMIKYYKESLNDYFTDADFIDSINYMEFVDNKILIKKYTSTETRRSNELSLKGSDFYDYIEKINSLEIKRKLIKSIFGNKKEDIFVFLTKRPSWFNAVDILIPSSFFFNYISSYRNVEIKGDNDYKEWFKKNLKRSRKKIIDLDLLKLNCISKNLPGFIKDKDLSDKILKRLNFKHQKINNVDLSILLMKNNICFNENWLNAWELIVKRDEMFLFDNDLSENLSNKDIPKKIKEVLKEKGIRINERIDLKIKNDKIKSNIFKILEIKEDSSVDTISERLLYLKRKGLSFLYADILDTMDEQLKFKLLLDSPDKVVMSFTGSYTYTENASVLFATYMFYSNTKLEYTKDLKEIIELNYLT